MTIDSDVASQLASESRIKKVSKSTLVKWALEQFLPDPDAGLELRPEVARRLRKPIAKRKFISHEEFWSKALAKK